MTTDTSMTNTSSSGGVVLPGSMEQLAGADKQVVEKGAVAAKIGGTTLTPDAIQSMSTEGKAKVFHDHGSGSPDVSAPDTTLATGSAGEAKVATNPMFAPGIAAILGPIEDDIVHMHSFQERVDANQSIAYQQMLTDTAHKMADLIMQQAELDFFTHIGMAVMDGVEAGVNIAGGVAGAALGPENAGMVKAFTTAGDSSVKIGSELVQGFSGLEKGKLQAQQELLKNLQTILQDARQKVEEDKSSSKQEKDQALSMLTKWQDEISRITFTFHKA